jgi:hypothetical protein
MSGIFHHQTRKEQIGVMPHEIIRQTQTGKMHDIPLRETQAEQSGHVQEIFLCQTPSIEADGSDTSLLCGRVLPSP